MQPQPPPPQGQYPPQQQQQQQPQCAPAPQAQYPQQQQQQPQCQGQYPQQQQQQQQQPQCQGQYPQQQQQQYAPQGAPSPQQPSQVSVAVSLDQKRHTLYMAGLVLICAGVTSLVCCWASYYFGFILSVGAIITGYTQVSHSRDQNAFLYSNSIVPARTAFGTIQMMNIAGVVLAAISSICAGAAVAFYVSFGDLSAFVAFGVIGLIASLTILFTAGFGVLKCGEVNRELMMLLPAPAPAPTPVFQQPPVAATGVYVAMPQTTVVYRQPVNYVVSY